MSHSPGPWTDMPGRDDGPTVIVSSDDKTVAEVRGSGEDARLIAAAPEMLELLREVTEPYDGDHFAKATEAARAGCGCTPHKILRLLERLK